MIIWMIKHFLVFHYLSAVITNDRICLSVNDVITIPGGKKEGNQSLALHWPAAANIFMLLTSLAGNIIRYDG